MKPRVFVTVAACVATALLAIDPAVSVGTGSCTGSRVRYETSGSYIRPTVKTDPAGRTGFVAHLMVPTEVGQWEYDGENGIFHKYFFTGRTTRFSCQVSDSTVNPSFPTEPTHTMFIDCEGVGLADAVSTARAATHTPTGLDPLGFFPETADLGVELYSCADVVQGFNSYGAVNILFSYLLVYPENDETLPTGEVNYYIFDFYVSDELLAGSLQSQGARLGTFCGPIPVPPCPPGPSGLPYQSEAWTVTDAAGGPGVAQYVIAFDRVDEPAELTGGTFVFNRNHNFEQPTGGLARIRLHHDERVHDLAGLTNPLLVVTGSTEYAAAALGHAPTRGTAVERIDLVLDPTLLPPF